MESISEKIIMLKLQQIEELIESRQQKEAQDEKFKGMPEWVNIEKAHSYKGGGSVETIKTNIYLQPCCGTNYKYVNGRKCFRKSDVIEWLSVTDDNLMQYAAKFGVRLPPEKSRRTARSASAMLHSARTEMQAAV
jgi:hypothetical protein